MSKYHGNIGFASMTETAPGVWEERVIERTYKGDLLSSVRRMHDSAAVNPELSANVRVEILMDSFLSENLFDVRYAVWRGGKWKITAVEERRPRVILNFGGLWNE